MKSTQELLKERTERVHKAIALEKTDRTPVIMMMDSFCARHMGVKLADFVSSLQASNKVMLDSAKDLGDFDGTNSAFAAGILFPLMFMTKVKLPGRELPDDTLWQLDERENITTDDYDTILNKGWAPFQIDYLKNRLGINLDKLFGELADTNQMVKNFEDAGYMVYSPLVTITVNEYLSGGRSMPRFIKDLYKIPDKVEAVLDVIQKETMDTLRQQIRATNSKMVFLAPSRGASEFFTPKLWERFVWKYIKGAADVIIEEGAVVNLHMDANWERDLDCFRSFPKGRAVFESDAATDIYKIKAALGDRMCIKGDVPATKLALGTPDEVYGYCTKLIKDMGAGFILTSGCSIPPNAKVENVKAMIAAGTGK
ncbi:uroporphyrinogen decarboxylase family protein [Acetonema longum]|uniref:Putative uroporphyrinogen-III decarboxylase-like protein n=1 Tax=Acetonema longum DSM 6540 TaxID=1009370 RepID=F7NLQ8_9FIRM|nr:uroporphyrinogen decarboxylase family protein [Acetonema longum]EGO62999.1 putative uroporphyrinogen-III decarboxylase-like protein [Acetonema longum DSM 6540]